MFEIYISKIIAGEYVKHTGEVMSNYKGSVLDKYIDKIDKMDEQHQNQIKEINRIYGDNQFNASELSDHSRHLSDQSQEFDKNSKFKSKTLLQRKHQQVKKEDSEQSKKNKKEDDIDDLEH